MFRVLQFNMQFGMGWNDEKPDDVAPDLNATIAEIRKHKADIVLLQEVEHALAEGRQVEPPPNYSRLISGLSEYDGFFSYPKSDPRELPFGIGLSILARAPLRNHIKVDIPSPPIEFEFGGRKMTPTDRLMIGATTTCDGRDVRVFNVHLLAFFMLGSSSTMFPWQRNLVADQISDGAVPTILGGDFNVSEHETLVAQFAGQGFSTIQDTLPTWRRRPYVLDHVFYDGTFRCVSHRIEPTMASDHHAVVADFEFVS